MRKKLLLLTLVLCLSFTAVFSSCGNEEPAVTPDTTAAADTTAAPETTAPEETTAERTPADNPPYTEPAKTPDGTVLYEHAVSATTYNDDFHFQINSTRGWRTTSTLNGKNVFNVLRILNNTSADGGLPKGEKMQVNLRMAPNFKTSELNAVHLSFEYIYVMKDGDMNVGAIDELQVLVSTDKGKTWAENTGYIVSQKLLGDIKTSDSRYGILYEVTTSDLAALVCEGETITDVILKPYGDYPFYQAAFRLKSVKFTVYDKAIERDNDIEYIEIPGDTLRQIAVAQIKKTAAIEWTSDRDINTMNYSDVGGVVTDLPMKYFGGYLHKGPLYTRVTTASEEMTRGYITADGKYIGPVDSDGAIGMDCSRIVFDAITRFASGNKNYLTTCMLADDVNMPLVAPFDNTEGLMATPDIIKKYTATELYQHYANCLPGDIAISRPDNVHVRLVSAKPEVVYKADGSIDPARSIIKMCEAGGTPFYYWQRENGTIIRSKTDPAIYGKQNPSYTFLYGASVRVDEEYTFAQLKSTNYVIMTLEEYQSGKIEKLDLDCYVIGDAEKVATHGLRFAIMSNYRVIDTRVTVKDSSGKAVIEKLTYHDSANFDLVFFDADLNAKLKALPAGDYTLTVEAKTGPVTEVGGETPVNEILKLDFKA